MTNLMPKLIFSRAKALVTRPSTTFNKYSLNHASYSKQHGISSGEGRDMRKDVIDLYKNLIHLSREWPTDLRPKIKQAFMKNKDVQDVEEIKRLIARGEYVSREIIATYHLRKYRAMKRRYYSDHREKQLEEMFKNWN